MKGAANKKPPKNNLFFKNGKLVRLGWLIDHSAAEIERLETW